MLSIDEAIAHAREVANPQKGKSGICLQNGLECEHFSDCLKCAEEHEQLAEWLEELKALREEKSDFQIMAKDIAEGNYEMGMENGYNKAIDDFINKINESNQGHWRVTRYEHGEAVCETMSYDIGTIKLIAEQLKERTEK